MKKLFTFLLTMGMAAMMNGQMANGSIAPDFTLTDIDGNEWNLYSILDQGKSVVIDFSATWCGPCWSYHSAHVLREVYDTYGPDGTDEMMVFFIEGDASTNSADLHGTGSNTQGDWVTGTTYPIIDDASVTSLFQIGYWPTIYHICPNRILTEIGQVTADTHYAANDADHCLGPISADEWGAINAGIIGYTSFEGEFCLEETFTPSVRIQNLGSTEMTAATVNMIVDGSTVMTKDWTGTLGQFETADVSLEELTVTENTDMNFEVVVADEEDATNNEITKSVYFGPQSQTAEITLELMTDDYGYETFWKVVDDMGTTIASGGNQTVGALGGGQGVATSGNAGAYGNNTLVTETITIPNGTECVRFVIYDDYADGICCSYGNGFYRITDGEGNVVLEGSEFEKEDIRPFENLGAVATNEISGLNTLNIKPNPVSDVFTLAFNLDEKMPLNIEIYNAFGQQVKSISSNEFVNGEHNITIGVSDFANGVYYVQFQSGAQQLSKKFVVNK